MSDYFLAIESSCDDTSVAVMQGRKVLSNIVATQEIHSKHGGVVPELASRAHQQLILPTIAEAISKAGITKNDLKAIAYTRGPGLMGSLLVGSSVAKGLAISMNIPLIEVNHMEAHILALMEERLDSPDFPFICLTVSGGHTQLVRVDAYNEMTILGATIDDAAGEAFDKTAKLLNLGYPGGPEIELRALNGDETIFDLPAPLLQRFDQLAAAAPGGMVVQPLRGCTVGLAAPLVLAVMQPQVVPHQPRCQMAGFGLSIYGISRRIALAEGHHLAPGLEAGFTSAAPSLQWCGGLIRLRQQLGHFIPQHCQQAGGEQAALQQLSQAMELLRQLRWGQPPAARQEPEQWLQPWFVQVLDKPFDVVLPAQTALQQA